MSATTPPLVVSLLLADASVQMLLGADGDALADQARRQLDGEASLDVRVSAARPMASLAAQLRDDPSPVSSAQVVVVGLVADLDEWLQADGPHDGLLAEGAFADALADVVAVAKEHGVTLIALNESTYDPAGVPVTYQDTGETGAVLLHRLNAVLIRTSMEHGISIVDVDRILSADGAARGLDRLAGYNEAVAPLIRAELLRVLEDYGFFDDRPPLEQLGRAGRKAAKARAAQQTEEHRDPAR